ncbi:MAG TPA: single-stranded-DNA-specific exonuclease RecJ [Phycisphaerales bacterium]|nr:single-stranded-DNA-specific exonuclease RecJ [Phycisphaerales bacterium]
MSLLARVFAARGLTDAAACEAFLNPTLRQLHNPSLMPNLDRAAERLLAAAKAGEPIVIYGDYDVDGITATAILYHTLKAIVPECNLRTYVPHRLEEGYGLNAEAIAELAAGGAKVIVSVDCGITATGPAVVARAAGVDLIVTDHHNLPGDGAFPDAYALVHPRLPGSAYPFGELCGAGVAYKLAWRLCTLACGSERVSEPLRNLLCTDLLALASLGVIADIVPLVGENRVMAFYGLRQIRHSYMEGLKALVAAAGLDGEKVGEEDVGFKLGPRLNACGRMGHAREAVELLTTATGARATEIAEELTRKNEERRRVEREIFEQACQMVEWEGMHRDDRRAIVLSHADWNPGVVGIVCSRLVERFGRPTILMREHDGECHGSGRSIDGYSLHAGLEHCAGHLKSFGGHDMAAGLKLESSRMREFVDAFIAHANERIAVEELTGAVGYDTDADIGELTTTEVQQLLRLAPFGRENPSIRLRIPAARIAGRAQTMGKNNKHLLFQLSSSAGSMRWLRVVGWNWADRIDEVPAGRVVDVLIAPKLNEWQGNARVEAELIDLRPAD